MYNKIESQVLSKQKIESQVANSVRSFFRCAT